MTRAIQKGFNSRLTTNFSPKATAFIASVLSLKPKLAVFDCDGTLWPGDAGAAFFEWELARGILPTPVAEAIVARYRGYKAGQVGEDDMCGEMVTVHQAMREDELRRLSAEFFAEHFLPTIFPDMLALVKALQAAGCDIWAVSSTNEWTIEAGVAYFGIPREKILAASVEIENGVITNRLVRVPSGDGKPKAIRDVIRRDPDAVFGNSRWDVDMLKIARHPFAVNPNPDLEQLAKQSGWTIYWPEGTGPH
jgi:phosphoserine phosphatase